MLSWIYWVIVVFFAYLVVRTLYREEKTLMQVSCALVLIALVLRIIGLK